MSAPKDLAPAALRRRLNLPLLILYGIGVTIGAGIYVLIGAVASHADGYAPMAFLLAAVVMGLTVCSYAELCARYPVAAGEAAYVKAAFGGRTLSTATGAMMIASGAIATATVALGASGYIRQFIDLPQPLIVVTVILVLGLVAVWGVLESVLLASLFTVIEVIGLVVIIAAAANASVPIGPALIAVPPLEFGAWSGIAFASLLAFFAFTGFEDLTNMAEEAHAPERDMPIAMGVTLIVTTALYMVIAAIAVTAVSSDRLAASDAPLALVFHEVAGISPTTISLIAIVATLNTIIAQMTMAIRVVYGMAKQGDLPMLFGHVNRATGTPIRATVTILATAMVLALFGSFERLAEFTSLATLIVFAMVNLALIRLRMTGKARRHSGHFSVPLIIPVLGFVSCAAMAISSLGK
jgi:amino acid transporter